MKLSIRARSSVAALAISAACSVCHAENVRVAVIDPLSGPFAPLGENQLRSFQYVADLANKGKWAGDNTLEFVGFDNNASVQESVSQLQRAIDQGYRYVAEANGSGVAFALRDAIEKYNARNPGKEILFLNHGAIDPELTNSKCSFWQFSFDANVDMKMQALVDSIAANKNIKKVYLINQNYAFGRSVSQAARQMLALKRPDIQIVGDDLHPIGEVRDFSPYVAKIKASGADTVITGNWGSDLSLLVKAARDTGLNANFYTYYAVLKGTPTAMGSAGLDRVKYVGVWNANNAKFLGRDIGNGFRKRDNEDFTWMQAYSVVAMLANGIKKAQSTEPVKVAYAMENMTIQSLNGEDTMRAVDHQLQQPLYIATWSKVDGKDVQIDQEGTGLGWKTDTVIAADAAARPTTCKMVRPSH